MENRQMMDNSLSVPADLIIRSVPINVELIDMIRLERERQEQQENERQGYKSVIQHIGKFIHLDQLDERDAKYYMQELCNICDEDI